MVAGEETPQIFNSFHQAGTDSEDVDLTKILLEA